MEITTKICRGCHESKPLTDYWKNRSASDGLQAYCKPCWYVKVREYERRHPEKYRARQRRSAHRKQARVYGTTVAELDARLAAQDFKCAICQTPESHIRTGRVRRLSLDHNHATGAARGFLCSKCNSGIGQFADDPARLRRAARYLAGYVTATD